MVDVKPFRGLFYDVKKVGSLADVVTLPYDIISETKQEKYYLASEYNYVRLVLGKEEAGDGEANNRYTRAAKYLEKWLLDGVLVKDANPGFYVYEQDYEIDGVKRKQSGMIALVKLEPFEKGVILPHEQIYEKPLLDRLNLIKAVQANLEMIIGIYSDPKHDTTRILKDFMKSKPIIDLSHDDGVRNRIWPVYDKKIADRLAELMKGRKVIIADGHHRYTTSLKYHLEQGKKDGPCAYIMMLLYNMDDELTVMPTHRVLKGVPPFDAEALEKKFGEYFHIKEFPFSTREKFEKLGELFASLSEKDDKHAFGVYAGSGMFYLLILKGSEMIEELLDSTKSRQWNELDVTILHSLVIEYLLGVRRDDSERIKYVKDKLKAVELVSGGEYKLAFFLNPTKLGQVKAIAEAGERMPQKSTYFYPKPLSGLVAYKF